MNNRCQSCGMNWCQQWTLNLFKKRKVYDNHFSKTKGIFTHLKLIYFYVKYLIIEKGRHLWAKGKVKEKMGEIAKVLASVLLKVPLALPKTYSRFSRSPKEVLVRGKKENTIPMAKIGRKKTRKQINLENIK